MTIDKKQAEAVAQAILDPDLRAQEEVQRKRAVQVARLARQRRAAWFALAGIWIGPIISFVIGYRFTLGIIWGGLTGSVVGWLATRRAA